MKEIGFLNSASRSSFGDFLKYFRKGLTDAGYVEDRDVKIVFKWANGDYDKLPKLAQDLVDRGVDLIAATGGAIALRAALKATDEIPILYAIGYNPAKMEFLGKAKGHGENATGVDIYTTESVPRRLRLLRQLVPDATKVAVLLRPRTQVYEREKEQAEKENLIIVRASTEGQLDDAFSRAVSKKARALLVCADPFFTSKRKKIVRLAKAYKIPAAYPFREYVEVGGLMSYGPDLTDVYRYVGECCGKVLDGTRPDQLRIQMKKQSDFDLFINQNAAAALDLEIPQSLRRQAEVV
jgi:putative ABC transport system substrate-binding protein